MAEFASCKVVSSLPGTLAANTLYFVRIGAGFRPYLTNNLGTVSAYALDPIAWSELAGPAPHLAERDLALAELSPGVRDFRHPNGFGDGFNTTAGIDSGASTNYSVAGGTAYPLRTPTGYTSVIGLTPNTTSTQTGYTYRTTFAAAQLTDLTSDYVRVRFHCPGTGTANNIAKAYIGIKSGTYGYVTPVQLTFSGNPGVKLAVSGSPVYSDPVAFTYDGTSDLTVGFYCSGGSGIYYNGTTTGWASHWKAGDDAATASPSGYTSPALATYTISGIEAATSFSVSNMDLRTASRTQAVVPTRGDLFALVEEVDALTADTDLKAYVSRDGDTSYVQGALSKVSLASGFYLYSATGIDLTGQASAANLRGRLTTHNSKSCRIHGLAVYGRA